jgi:hypothetical protein
MNKILNEYKYINLYLFIIMYDELYNIKHFIELLNKQRQIEVLKILTDNNIQISENKNGSFVNLTILPSDIIEKLKEFTIYIKEQDISFEEIEDVKKDFKSSFFSSTSKKDNILNVNKEKAITNNNAVERNV